MRANGGAAFGDGAPVREELGESGADGMAADDEAHEAEMRPSTYPRGVGSYEDYDQTEAAFAVECDTAMANIISSCLNDCDLAAMVEYMDSLDPEVAAGVLGADRLSPRHPSLRVPTRPTRRAPSRRRSRRLEL